MTTNEIILIAAGVSLVYALLSLVIATGARRFNRKIDTGAVFPSVTVIVCARNEEASLSRCLESLVLLDYPEDLIEIILVDDESEDQTRAVMDRFAAVNPRVRVLSTAGQISSFRGKQRPLDLAMKTAGGDLVFLTDADCAVVPTWIERHRASYKDTTVGMVGGMTGIVAGGGLLGVLQDGDQISKLAIAKGAAGLGLPLTVMGNNLSFRKSAWDAVGGFDTIGPSFVEDVDLMYAIVRNTPYRLAWERGRGCSALSLPFAGFGQFIHQRRRMLKITRKIPVIGFALIMAEIIMTALVIGSAAFDVTRSQAFPLLFSSWLAGQTTILWAGVGMFRPTMLLLPVQFVFQVVYGAVLGVAGLFSRSGILWKGRRI